MRIFLASRGFTLLELVVVMFIIGVVFASAIVVLPLDGRDPLHQELQTLAQRVNRIRDKAVFDARPYGLGLWHRGYGFFAWDPDKGWLVLSNGEGLSSTEFVTVEVLELVAAGLTTTVADEALTVPQVVFPPSGEVTTLDARMFAVSGEEYRFFINALGGAGFAVR